NPADTTSTIPAASRSQRPMKFTHTVIDSQADKTLGKRRSLPLAGQGWGGGTKYREAASPHPSPPPPGGRERRLQRTLAIRRSLTKTSNLQQQPLRLLDALLYAHKEQHRLAPVDQAMIVRQRHVHHRPHHDLVVADDGPLLDRVQP